ncbi:MAG: ATP-binding protein [Bacteroidaceae bacterium]|nr:ATP-binding protein [Bacteroidaceae bacterium]MBR1789670.1 ATP-binding protein [Bacteroidaceae bacterium]
MEAFFRTHSYLVEHMHAPVRRALMDEIDWSKRLIGIKGSRGVGKTSFLLQYAKENFNAAERKCLYINMNNFYFQGKSISDFAKEFYDGGGKVLLIDQVFKDPEWSCELRKCYDNLPGLKIVFTGSSVMRLKEENPELNGIVASYNLRGFSFREYLNLKTGLNLKAHSLEEVLNQHTRITAEVCQVCNPLEHFQSYIHHGYYPFFLEQRNFSENLIKVMNMMIEVDILLIKQIELKYLSKIKKLLYLLAMSRNAAPNVSQLAIDIQTSRATVANYIKYLADARLVNVLYRLGESAPKKPAKVMLHNPNLMYAMLPQQVDEKEAIDCFFQNALWGRHIINTGDRTCDFVVDCKHRFRLLTEEPRRQQNGVYTALNGIKRGYDRQIPLWLFGFLY